MKDCRFSLKMDVKDGGDLSLSFERDFETQGDMQRSVACVIAKALSVMNCPPADYEIVHAMNGYDFGTRCPFAAMAELQSRFWTGVHNFDKAVVAVTVDVGALCAESNQEEIRRAVAFIRRMGWEAANIPEPEGP